MSKTKLFEELLCLDIFQKEGGLPNSKVFEVIFCLILEIYQEGGAPPWLPDSKTFEELFCLRLDIFQEKGGGVYLIPKMMRNIFVFTWTFFKLNLGG